MKKILFMLMLCFSMMASAQTNDYYILNIVIMEGDITQKGLKVKVDNGKKVEKLKNDEGKDMKFNTPAAALMYFISQGWEICENETTFKYGTFSDDSKPSLYWIIKKPCTKEEFDKAVEDGINKKK